MQNRIKAIFIALIICGGFAQPLYAQFYYFGELNSGVGISALRPVFYDTTAYKNKTIRTFQTTQTPIVVPFHVIAAIGYNEWQGGAEYSFSPLAPRYVYKDDTDAELVSENVEIGTIGGFIQFTTNPNIYHPNGYTNTRKGETYRQKVNKPAFVAKLGVGTTFGNKKIYDPATKSIFATEKYNGSLRLNLALGGIFRIHEKILLTTKYELSYSQQSITNDGIETERFANFRNMLLVGVAVPFQFY